MELIGIIEDHKKAVEAAKKKAEKAARQAKETAEQRKKEDFNRDVRKQGARGWGNKKKNARNDELINCNVCEEVMNCLISFFINQCLPFYVVHGPSRFY